MAPELDRAAQAILDVIAAAGTPHLSTLSVDEARDSVRTALVTKGAPRPLHQVEDRRIPGPSGELGVRLYRPKAGVLPAALFLHGGGWTVNDLDTHDDLCRRLAERSGWLLVSLDYRRAPEHKHPAALDDAEAGFRWLVENAASIGGDPARLAVVGESSGGMTAASMTARLLRDGGPLPVFQALFYPATDVFDRWPSYRERGDGYILDRELMRWYFEQYLPADAATDDPDLYPLAVADLSGLPPTLLVTTEFDPLRDEGLEYAKRLKEAGVRLEHVHASDQMHGVLLLARVVPAAAALVDQVGDSLAAAG